MRPGGKHERLLWVVAAATALHATEEYFAGWVPWAASVLGIGMPPSIFIVANIVLFAMALLFASFGWRHPIPGLAIAVATVLNAVTFHIVPSVVSHSPAPGIVTAVFLYLPFSIWTIVGALRDGVARRQVQVATAVGAAIAFGVVGLARVTFPA